MKNINKLTISLSVILIASSCAFNYKAPTGKSKSAKANITDSNKVFKSAKRSLLLNDYKISYSDKEEGIVSSAYKNFKVNPTQADCGETLGLDYLKDKRTKTEVSFNIIIDKKQIEVKSSIKGEYKPNSVAGVQNITLTCISKGVLERDLLNKIIRR